MSDCHPNGIDANLTYRLGTSIEPECLFSRGRLVLTHVWGRLSAQITRALLCVGSWSLLDLIEAEDINSATVLPDVQNDDEDYQALREVEEGWDKVDAVLNSV